MIQIRIFSLPDIGHPGLWCDIIIESEVMYVMRSEGTKVHKSIYVEVIVICHDLHTLPPPQ